MRDISFIRPKNEYDWDILMFLALVCLIFAAYLTHDINFPWGVGTQSRALYVDEGFYSDAAQNLVKLGHWGMLHDSRHWPGSPLTALLQSAAFLIFGASIEVARMLSVVLGVIGAWALYSIAKVRFHPGVSILLVFSSISTMTYLTIARSAITDPVAMTMFLIAVWAFTRMENRSLAIPLSLSFAFLAFFSKMYFIFAFATVIALWIGELLLLPLVFRRRFSRTLLEVLLLSLLLIGLAYLSYRRVFDAEISNFLAINADKKPTLELDRILRSLRISYLLIPRHTQSAVFLYTLSLTIVYATLHFIITRFISLSRRSNSLLDSLARISRAEWAMGIFLVSGLLTVGSLRLLRTHYHFFAILPIAFLAIAMIYHLVPRKLAAYLSITVLLVHIAYQGPAYREWLSRPEPRLIDTVSRDIVDQLHGEYPHGLIPVIGQFSAQLGLFSERIISIDAKWVSQEGLCERLNYWKPPYHVNVVWNHSRSRKIIGTIEACPTVKVKYAPVLFPTFSGKTDFIALSKLSYESDAGALIPILLLLQE